MNYRITSPSYIEEEKVSSNSLTQVTREIDDEEEYEAFLEYWEDGYAKTNNSAHLVFQPSKFKQTQESSGDSRTSSLLV
jgi:hypothetical protein